MASIHKSAKSRFFQAAYVDADGRRVMRSTKQTNRSNAWRVALAYEDAAKDARQGTITGAHMRKVIAATLKSVSTEAYVTHSIKDWCNAWMDDKRACKSEGTAKRYGTEIRNFLVYLGKKADRDISQLTKLDIQGYRDLKTKQGLTAASVNIALKALRNCLGLAVSQQLITTNPAMAVSLLTKSDSNKRALKRVEVLQILAATDDDEWIGVIKLGYYVGARLSNTARMEWGDFDFEKGLVTYTPVKQRANRKPKTLQLPIHPDLLKYLNPRRKPSGPIFARLSKMNVSGKTGLSLTFRALLDKAGIIYETKEANGEKGRKVNAVGFHSLRHSFNTDLANLGGSQEIRQKLIGHASEAVNDGYTELDITTLTEAVNRLPALA